MARRAPSERSPLVTKNKDNIINHGIVAQRTFMLKACPFWAFERHCQEDKKLYIFIVLPYVKTFYFLLAICALVHFIINHNLINPEGSGQFIRLIYIKSDGI